MKSIKTAFMMAFCVLLSFGLVACGGSGGGGGGGKKKVARYTISGSISGLAGSGLVLEDNGGDDLAIIKSGAFTFPTKVANGQSYTVTVLTQPHTPNQICTVNKAMGIVNGTDVTDVAVICSTESYNISGTATGIIGNVVLQDNGSDDLTLTSDGPFTFTTPVADTAGYDVTIHSSTGQSCALTNSSGTMSGAAVTDVALTCIPVSAVESLYIYNGANWNDYVSNDGGSIFNATDTACNAGSDPSCLHGGEMRTVQVPGVSSCTGVTASDTLGAFDWTCDDSTDPVRVVSTGLKKSKYLSDLIDFDTTAWKDNSVTVIVNSVPFTTSPAAWWSNPVSDAGDGSSALNTAGTIYVVTGTADLTSNYNIGASKVGLVAKPGAIINGPVSGSYVIYSYNSDFLWLEGTVDATGLTYGIYLSPARFDMLKGVTASNATSGFGIYLDYNSRNNTLSDVTASDNADGIHLSYAANNTFTNVTVMNNSGNGMFFDYNSNNNTLSDITASKNSIGISFGYSTNNNMLSNITASNNSYDGLSLSGFSNGALSNITATGNGVGLYLQSSSNNALSNITANNNQIGMYLFSSSNSNTFTDIVTNNGQSGIFFDSSSGNTFNGLTASNNSSDGITIRSYSNSNTFTDITATNNLDGVIFSGASNNSLSNVAASNNTYEGVHIGDTSNNNLLTDVMASNNNTGVVINTFSSNNMLGDVTVSNNDMGIFIDMYSDNNTLSRVTSSNNSNYGVLLFEDSNNNLFSSLTASNNNNAGVALASYSDNNTFSGLAASNNLQYGVYLQDSSNNYFTGPLKVGNNASGDCYVSGGGSQGLLGTTCTTDGSYGSNFYGIGNSSDASLYNGVDLSSSFVGMTYYDTANANATGSAIDYAIINTSTFDWTNFQNRYREWGKDGTFGTLDSQGQWVTSGYGAIWDWSVSLSDMGEYDGSPAILNALSMPTGNDTITHAWSGTAADQAACDSLKPGSVFVTDHCESTFLRNAVEINGTGGNNNLLCESGETCLYTPNIASYQGHGSLVSAGSIGTGGTLQNITLLKYDTNGRSGQ